MIDLNEQSLINIAVDILEERHQGNQEPVDLYELFDMVLEKKGVEIESVSDVLSSFYADITSSAQFVYTGQNRWDLKKHHKIELWEKDGSHFNEYLEVDDPELDEIIAHKAHLEKEHQEKLERRRIQEAEKLKEAEEAETLVEEIEEVPVVEAIEEEVIEAIEEEVVEVEKAEETETEVEEEYDDFDEDEYNEYMDTYEDEYDK